MSPTAAFRALALLLALWLPSTAEAQPQALAELRFAPSGEAWTLQASPPWDHDLGPWQTVCDGPCLIRIPAERYRFRLRVQDAGVRMPILRESLTEGARYLAAATFERETSYPDEGTGIFSIVGAGAASVAAAILGGFLTTSGDEGEVAGGVGLLVLSAVLVAVAIWLGWDLVQPRHTDVYDLSIEPDPAVDPS